jgi:pyruvate/2-oxoglutarate dehydrogenase complex dihydrolipoamide dehydrogenase (E3) component
MDAPALFDAAIIGSGPGGYRAAVLAAERGLRAAVVEGHSWGGTCLNRGCVPKMAWHHTAQLIAHAKSFARRGVDGELRADLAQAWHHQRRVVQTAWAWARWVLPWMGTASSAPTPRTSAPPCPMSSPSATWQAGR